MCAADIAGKLFSHVGLLGEYAEGVFERVGNFVLHREIGRGGTSTVYVGSEIGSARRVAVKKLHEHLADDPKLGKMLSDEAALGARIRHPNAIPVSDLVIADGTPYAIMNYLHGESLAGIRKRVTEYPIGIAVAIACDALAGLHAAHESTSEAGELLGVVHRDVAPDNIMIGADGIARITDFGIAKALGRSQVTATGVVKGKFRYMAPEQAGGETSRQSDVFSMGVVLWEMLTSVRLFDAEHEATIVMQLMSKPIPPPSSVRSGVAPALDAVVLKALSRNKATRFATALDMHAALLAATGAGSIAKPAEIAAWLHLQIGQLLADRMHLIEADEAASNSVSRRVTDGADATQEAAAARASSAGFLGALSSRDIEVTITGSGQDLPLQPVPQSSPSYRTGVPTASDTGEYVPASIAPKRGSRAFVGIAVGAAVLLAGGAGGAYWRRANSAELAAAAGKRIDHGTWSTGPSAPRKTPNVTAPSVPAPSASATATAAESAIAKPLIAPKSSASVKHAAPQPVIRTTARPLSKNCDPPYSVDANGFRVYRRECLIQ